MAKACAYLCLQCCFIDGFGEFGEFIKFDISETTEQEIPEVSLRYHVNATLMNSPLSAGQCGQTRV